jgi:hypothetical protein
LAAYCDIDFYDIDADADADDLDYGDEFDDG